jgi:BMFP domain-containing protein YqiC
MLNKNVIDEINTKVSEILQNSPAKDIEKNLKVLLSGAFTRLDLITRDEFDIQQEVLQRTREKLIILEARVTELEAKLHHSAHKPAASHHAHEEHGKEHQ